MYRKVTPLEPTQVYHTDLTDAQWARLAPLLPRHQGSGRAQQLPLRLIVNACLYLVRAGCQWRLLPREYPKWEIVYYHFAKWHRDRTWEDVLSALREQDRVAAGRDPAPSMLIVASQSTKTTEMGGDVGYDAGKNNQGTEAAHCGRYAGDAGGYAGPRNQAPNVPRTVGDVNSGALLPHGLKKVRQSGAWGGGRGLSRDGRRRSGAWQRSRQCPCAG